MQIEVTECLLSLGAEPFVFQFAIQEYKDYGIQNYSFPVFCKGVKFGQKKSPGSHC